MTAGDKLLVALRDLGLRYPGAHGKAPWPGHDDLAVNDKTFAYLSAAGEPFSASFKLRYTSDAVLAEPWAKPTGYGLGKAGWVTITPDAAQLPTLDQLAAWLDESYRAQAPKRLIKDLEAREA